MQPVVMTREPLTDAELSLVRSLRNIPEGAARDELLLLIRDLVNFVHDPRCTRSQGDGVPCVSLGTSCEQCRDVADTLVDLHGHLHLHHAC
jgi:hypothetical protein